MTAVKNTAKDEESWPWTLVPLVSSVFAICNFHMLMAGQSKTLRSPKRSQYHSKTREFNIDRFLDRKLDALTEIGDKRILVSTG